MGDSLRQFPTFSISLPLSPSLSHPHRSVIDVCPHTCFLKQRVCDIVSTWTMSALRQINLLTSPPAGLSNPVDTVFHLQPVMILTLLPLAILVDGWPLSLLFFLFPHFHSPPPSIPPSLFFLSPSASLFFSHFYLLPLSVSRGPHRNFWGSLQSQFISGAPLDLRHHPHGLRRGIWSRDLGISPGLPHLRTYPLRCRGTKGGLYLGWAMGI